MGRFGLSERDEAVSLAVDAFLESRDVLVGVLSFCEVSSFSQSIIVIILCDIVSVKTGLLTKEVFGGGRIE